MRVIRLLLLSLLCLLPLLATANSVVNPHIQFATGGGGGSLTMTTLSTRQNNQSGESVTPADNSLLVVISCSGSGASGQSISNNGGLTFTEGESLNTGAYRIHGVMWYTEIVTGSAVTIDLSGASTSVFDWLVLNFEGYDTVTPIGLTASDGLGNDARTGSLTGSLGGTSASDSIVVGCFASNNSAAGDMTSDASWTELAEDTSNYTTHFTYIEGAVSDFEMATATTSPSTYQGWLWLAFEVNAN